MFATMKAARPPTKIILRGIRENSAETIGAPTAYEIEKTDTTSPAKLIVTVRSWDICGKMPAMMNASVVDSP